MVEKSQLTENVEHSKFSHISAGRVDFFPKFPPYIDQIEVTDTNSAYVISSDAKFVIFSIKGDVSIAVRADGTAVFPSADITDGTGSLINPTQFGVEGISTLNFIAEPGNTTYVSLAIYA